jgi:hypothetical protein
MTQRSELSRWSRVKHYLGIGRRARRKQALADARAITGRAEEIKSRLSQLEGRSPTSKLADVERRRRVLRDQLSAMSARTSSEVIDQAAAEEREISDAISKIEQEQEAMAADVAAVETDSAQLSQDWELVRQELDETSELGLRLITQGTIAAEVISAAAWLVYANSSGPSAADVHLDYYSAVALIVPVLIVAGFVELGIQSRAGAWDVLAFIIPAIGAQIASLITLATHRSTAASLYFTGWGLGLTFLTLIILVIGHAERSKEETTAGRAIRSVESRTDSRRFT